MSIPMNNINQAGGFVAPGRAPGYPPSDGYLIAGHPPPPSANYGFIPGQSPAGYTPVPQAPPCGEGLPYNPGQLSYASPAVNPGMSPASPYNGGFQPGHQPGAIVMQPSATGGPPNQMGDWMSIPVGIPNCPRGLEYLTSIDQLLVKQKVELLEAFTGFETNNKFSIKNALGQKVYFAVEENDCCTRNCCGPARPFEMKILDNYQNEVIHINRPLACSSCWFPCCLQTMEVSAPPGNVIGTIEQEWSILSPSFRLKNHVGDTVLRIEGPLCTFSICGDVEFDIVSMTGEKIGKISKQWSGLAREIFTDADFFGIKFPLDLDVRMKAVLLGATFLIDAMFFEKSGQKESDRPGMF